MTTMTELPASLRTVSNDRPRAPSALGTRPAAPIPDISRLGVEALFRLQEQIWEMIERAREHERLFATMGDKMDEMRVEAEGVKARLGLPNAFALLPIVREAAKDAAY